MYLRRHCYDKPWRCPGWAGGGWTHPKTKRCDGGRLDVYDRVMRPWWFPLWRFSRCGRCDVRAVPLITKWVDPTWLNFWVQRIPGRIKGRVEEWRWRRGWRRGR